MKTATWVKIFWGVLAAGVGGTTLYVSLLVVKYVSTPNTSPLSQEWYYWLAASVTAFIMAAVHLRECYRREPFHGSGRWQLHIADLIVVSLITGFLLSLFNARWPEILVPVGIPVCLLIGAGLIGGILVAARKGSQSGFRKFLYGLGWVMCIYGALFVGVLVVVLVAFATLDFWQFGKFVSWIFAFFRVPMEDEWAPYIFRAGLACLLFGPLCLYAAQRGLPKEERPPAAPDGGDFPPERVPRERSAAGAHEHSMKISTQKTLWWWVLAMGVGGTALFAISVLVAYLSVPRSRTLQLPFRWYYWQIATVAASITAAVHLRECYHREPFHGSGRWQLHIADLIVVSLITGFLLSLFNARWPEILVPVGIPVCLLIGAGLTGGILVAKRKGLPSGYRKSLYVLGWFARLYGALSVGALAAVLLKPIIMYLWHGLGWFAQLYGALSVSVLLPVLAKYAIVDFQPGKSLLWVFGFSRESMGAEWLWCIFSAGLVSLPLGLLCLRLAQRGLPREGRPPAAREDASPPSRHDPARDPAPQNDPPTGKMPVPPTEAGEGGEGGLPEIR